MSGTQVFTSERFGSIRAVEREGRPWLVAKDVCAVLGLGRQQEYTSLFRNTERRYCMVDTIRNSCEMVVISPSAFERLVAVSKCDDKEDVRDWVSREVLPSVAGGCVAVEGGPGETQDATPAPSAASCPVGDGGELIARALIIAKEIIDRKDGESSGADRRIADISKRLADVGEQLQSIARDLAGAARASGTAPRR